MTDLTDTVDKIKVEQNLDRTTAPMASFKAAATTAKDSQAKSVMVRGSLSEGVEPKLAQAAASNPLACKGTSIDSGKLHPPSRSLTQADNDIRHRSTLDSAGLEDNTPVVEVDAHRLKVRQKCTVNDRSPELIGKASVTNKPAAKEPTSKPIIGQSENALGDWGEPSGWEFGSSDEGDEDDDNDSDVYDTDVRYGTATGHGWL